MGAHGGFGVCGGEYIWRWWRIDLLYACLCLTSDQAKAAQANITVSHVSQVKVGGWGGAEIPGELVIWELETYKEDEILSD